MSKTLLDQMENYCNKTTLHGLRYIGDSSLSFGERIFWFISFSVAIGFASYYITNIYEKWIASPVIISFSPFDTELSSIPFPAITICNMNQAKKSEAEKILKDRNVQELKLLNDLCRGNQTFPQEGQYNWTMLKNFLVRGLKVHTREAVFIKINTVTMNEYHTYINETKIGMLIKDNSPWEVRLLYYASYKYRVGNSCSDLLKICEWTNDRKDCDDLFNNDLTDEGLCCSFNRLPPEKIFRNAKDISILNQTYPSYVYEWNPEKGFTEKENGDEDLIPKRPLGAGSHLGLTLILDAQIDEYYCSSTSSVGFKIIMSNPIEAPKMADFGSLMSPGKEVRYSINPTVRTASENLRSVSLDKRQCYFANERRLQYFRSYTKGNCNLECQSNYTYQKCSCIPFFLPRSTTISVCGKSAQECVEIAKEDMEITYGNGSGCHCLPGCFEISYSATTSSSKLTTKINVNYETLKNISNRYFVQNMAVVHFFFPTAVFSTQIKSQLYGFTEILSNVGGLLGLFLGFSFLSFIEIIYFISLRVLCNYFKLKRKIKEKKKKNSSNDEYIYPFMK